MRPIHWATLDKRRPALVLTRGLMVGRMSTVTIAPITTTNRGIATEVPVSRLNGLDQDCAVKCDQIVSIAIDRLHERCGWLFDDDELALHEAIRAAFDLV
ncbi:MAG TPA: type II toxin-antitoxin system PemK/MazF family toxin [Mycobacteriales bacterium]|nr:type II toxin-antitoxin system PemK/MazF family toxin [Mycobacteriales bacterium]